MMPTVIFERLRAIKFSRNTTRDQVWSHEHTANSTIKAFELQVPTVMTFHLDYGSQIWLYRVQTDGETFLFDCSTS